MENQNNIFIPWPGWQVVRRLGSGGFGAVYEIERDLYGTKEREALKVIRIPKEESELEEDYNSGMTEEEVCSKYTYIQRYMVEEYRQMLKYKGHSNIVNCHDFSVVQNRNRPGCTIYIRMELLTPLKEVLRSRDFSEPNIIQMAIDICRALEVCEQNDTIHRDIKPDNILMSEFGTFKLGDFGLARTMEKTMSASMVGTDWYMAPEVAKKMKYGKSVDTYSLGLVLYWLLNGYRIPFVPIKDRITAKDMENAYRIRMQGTPIPPPAQGSARLKEIVLKAVSYSPEQRYRSAADMLADLRLLQNPAAKRAARPAAQPQVPAEKPQAPKQRRPSADAEDVLGIYFDTEEIHVRLLVDGETRPILQMPAVYTCNDLSEVLAGNRAVNYQKCRKDKQLYSVLDAMIKADTSNSASLKQSEEEKCCSLMKDLKRNLDRTPYGKIQNCVVTVPVSSLVLQKSVYKAMQQAGFRVIRQLDTAVACAVSKAYTMSCNQSFTVCAAANHEQRYAAAVYEDNVLEIGDPTVAGALLEYHAGDKAFCRAHRDKAAGYEDLATVAADGAALQGAAIKKPQKKKILVLDAFPWKAGVEIVQQNGQVCLPLTWLMEAASTIPAKSKALSVRLDAGIRGTRLRLYTTGPQSRRMIREWELDKACGFRADAKQLELSLWLGLDIPSIRIELKSRPDEQKLLLDFLKDQQADSSCGSYTAGRLPEEIRREVCEAAEKFRADAGRLADMEPAIEQGVRMIAKQSAEFFGNGGAGAPDKNVDGWIEKTLTIADNLEYGLKEAERMNCTGEKLLLLCFYKAIRDTLQKLDLTAIEAEGMRFDPHIHHAMMAERFEGVEEDMIIEEIQKGYFRAGKLLRPARVKVAK